MTGGKGLVNLLEADGTKLAAYPVRIDCVAVTGAQCKWRCDSLGTESQATL